MSSNVTSEPNNFKARFGCGEGKLHNHPQVPHKEYLGPLHKNQEYGCIYVDGFGAFNASWEYFGSAHATHGMEVMGEVCGPGGRALGWKG